MIHIGYIAAGIIIAWATWIITGYLRNDFIRTTLRAITTAICVTPAIVAGHGVGVIPAFLLIIEEKYFWWGVIPIISVSIILFIVFFSIPRIREGYIKDKISWRDVLIRPPQIKLFLIGLILVLAKSEFREFLRHYWVLHLFIFAGITGLHFFLCHAIQRDKPQSSGWLPVWLSIPLAIDFYPAAIFYYLGGLAGCFSGERAYSHAWLTGLIASGLASLNFGMQLYNAIKYANVQHIKIQAGITGSAILFAIVAAVFIICLLGFRKYYLASQHSKT